MSRSQAPTGSAGGNEPPRRPNNAKDKSHHDERFRVSKKKPAEYAGICLRCNKPRHGTRQAKDCDRACASCGEMEHFGTWCPEFQTKTMWAKYAYNGPPDPTFEHQEDKAIDLEQQLNDAQAEAQKLMDELSCANDDNENLRLVLQATQDALVEAQMEYCQIQRDFETLQNNYLAKGMALGQMQNPPQQWFAPGHGYPPFGFAPGPGSLQPQPGQPSMPFYPYPNMNEVIARAQFGPTNAYNQRGPIAYIGQQQPIQAYAPHPSIQQWAPLLQAHQQAPQLPTLSHSPAQLHHGDAHQAFQQPMQDGGTATVAKHQTQSLQIHQEHPQDHEPSSSTQDMASPEQLDQYTSPHPERSPQIEEPSRSPRNSIEIMEA